MARATRIALDLALVSLRTVSPVVSNIWSATKRLLINTPAKPLVCNSLIKRAENALDKIASMLVSKIKTLRDRQLPEEKKYLEKELEKVKKKIDQTTAKSLKPGCEIAWRYAKVEMIPPMTQGFFHGPGGKKLEDAASKFANNFIAGLEGRIREIEAEKEREIKAKEAAIKAAHEKVKAQAKIKEEQRLKEEAEKKAQEANKAKETTDKGEKKPATAAKSDAKPAAKAAAEPVAKADAKTKGKGGERGGQKSKKVTKKEIKKTKGPGKNKKDSKPKK